MLLFVYAPQLMPIMYTVFLTRYCIPCSWLSWFIYIPVVTGTVALILAGIIVQAREVLLLRSPYPVNFHPIMLVLCSMLPASKRFMLDAFCIQLCSKLCYHNLHRPTDYTAKGSVRWSWLVLNFLYSTVVWLQSAKLHCCASLEGGWWACAIQQNCKS